MKLVNKIWSGIDDTVLASLRNKGAWAVMTTDGCRLCTASKSAMNRLYDVARLAWRTDLGSHN